MRKTEILNWVHKLPPLPESIQKLEALFASTRYPETNEIVKVIESDPALAADILSFSNSPLFGFAKKIQSIQQAVVLFGAPQIRKMALKSALFSSFSVDMSAYGITNEEFIKISSYQSDLIFRWYMGIDIDKSKILIPLAFLMEAGAIVISRFVIDNALKEAFLNDLSKLDTKEVEILHTNMSATQVDYILFEHWGLDDIFAKTMHVLDNELYKADWYIEELAFALKVVRTAINLKSQFLEEDIQAAALMLEQKGFESKKFLHACESLRKKFEES